MGAKVCFLGVPWDQGQIVRAGTSQGPRAARGDNPVFPYMFEYDVDILTFFNVVDCGDVPTVPGNNEKSHEYICDYVTECLEGGAKVILCGGDHSLPIPGRAPCRVSPAMARWATCMWTAISMQPRLGRQHDHQLLRPVARDRAAELLREEHGASGLAQQPQPEGLVRLLRRQRHSGRHHAPDRRTRAGGLCP